jgi:hypothetical protein
MAKHAKDGKRTVGGFRLESMRMIEESPAELRDRREERERFRERMATNFQGWGLGAFVLAIWVGIRGAPWYGVAAALAGAVILALIGFSMTKSGAAKARRAYEAYRSLF